MKTFDCEICSAIYSGRKEAENCCGKEKAATLCNVCGKTRRNKKQAIRCCSVAKKKLS